VRSKFAVFVDTYGAGMIPEDVKSPDPECSAKSEGTQPKDWPQEDPDTARGEAFKRMFPDVPRKTPERPEKPSE
jgi:hypothetical protein